MKNLWHGMRISNIILQWVYLDSVNNNAASANFLISFNNQPYGWCVKLNDSPLSINISELSITSITIDARYYPGFSGTAVVRAFAIGI